MARHGQTLLFSSDDQLLGKALDTLGQTLSAARRGVAKDALVPFAWRRSRSPNSAATGNLDNAAGTWSRYSAIAPTPT